MTDHPIIFSGPMVRALLDGRKTMTRRLAWRDPEGGLLTMTPIDSPHYQRAVIAGRPTYWQKVKPGDRLWVREAWRAELRFDWTKPRDLRQGVPIYYETADAEPMPECAGKPRRSFHMPRWASRLTLVVTSTKIERLQDISNEDCIAEGVPVHSNENAPRTGPVMDAFARRHGLISHYGGEFRRLWTSLHGPVSWDDNPEVVALTFTVHQKNIDRLEPPA